MSAVAGVVASSARPRYTLRGGDAVEEVVHGLCREVSARIGEALPDDDLVAAVLIGGYGRGEGGVVVGADGAERPHNNLDVLVVVADRVAARAGELKRAIDARVQPLADASGVGIDVGVIGVGQLRGAPCLVMWYDMREGHRTLRGDAAFVPGLARFTLDRVLPADMRNLLVNRGTLLVINDLLLERGGLDEPERATVVRHAVKAVIGYGDALLFAHGAYHWSYAERQRRMRALAGAPAGMRELYERAMEFRFRPDYAAWLRQDLHALAEELRERLEPVHRAVEAARLGLRDLVWPDYPRLAGAAALGDRTGSLRAIAQRCRDLVRTPAMRGGGGPLRRLGWRALGARGRLAVCFPAVAYPQAASAMRPFAARALGDEDRPAALRRAYLRAWGRDGDPNLAHLLRRLRIDLAGGGP